MVVVNSSALLARRRVFAALPNTKPDAIRAGLLFLETILIAAPERPAWPRD
jgi:hypothetical protein